MSPRNQSLGLLMLLLLLGQLSKAQDPFFTHFFNNEAIFNPALVGYRGATSLGIKYKTQWDINTPGQEVPPYETMHIGFEESMPCSILDYGFNVELDREGEGILRTIQFGGQVAGTIPIGGKRIVSNVRIGAGLQWGQKSIDYSRLIFSDQLDAKYGLTDAFGNVLQTNFLPPNGGQSLWYFAPSVGFSYRALFLKKYDRDRSPTLHIGAAYHNIFALGEGNYYGNEESLLGIGTTLPRRLSLFATYEMIPFTPEAGYISIKPSVFYQHQENIDILMAGVRVGLNRVLAAGVYANFNGPQAAGVNTNWLTFTLELGTMLQKSSRLDLGLAYSANYSALRNNVGPIFEISAVYHIGKSALCGLMNQDNDLTRAGISCPTTTLTAARNKMYEGIWYQ